MSFFTKNPTQAKAWSRLKELAKNPPDLTQEGVLTPERMSQYKASLLGFDLFYGSERVDDTILEALFELAQEQEILSQLEKMQEGAILNKIEGYSSEERAVLHTAMRDLSGAVSLGDRAQKARSLALIELEKLRRFSKAVDTEGWFTTLLMIGIGGSDLGPRAHYIALERYLKLGRKVKFISNVDPDDASYALQGLNLEKTLVAVVSKSGTTLETRTNEAFVREAFQKKGLDPKQYFVAITGEKSPMDSPKEYLESFYIWDFVGGRYSTTSMVGSLMIAFAFGFDSLLEFLRGANEMDEASLSFDPKKNIALLSALLGVWNRNFLQHETLAILPYAEALSRYPAHLQQLDMESNGKSVDRMGKRVTYETGPILWGEPGTNGQHSFYQLLHQGTSIVPAIFIGFKQSEKGEDLFIEGTNSQEKLLSNLFAQVIALAKGKKNENPNKCFEGNRPSHLVVRQKLTPYSLGGLLSFFENRVALQGFLWNINSFDQEGVQLGKKLAEEAMDIFEKKRTESPLENESPLLAFFVDEVI